MEYRRLGSTGLKVSELCMGTMTMGRATDEQTARVLLDRFADAGGIFLDTADVYTEGRSEEIVGRWLNGRRRSDFVVATKVRGRTGQGPNDAGLSRKHIYASVETSLRRLQTDHIDLYQIHSLDYETPIEETLATLDDLVRSGKVRYIGTSNVSGWYLQKVIEVARRNGWEAYVSTQPRYNLLARGPERNGLVSVCQQEGLGLLPWSPLYGGWLSGKYRRGMGGAPDGSRMAERSWIPTWTWELIDRDDAWPVIDEVTAVAGETGRTPAQVSLRWLLQRPAVTAPIIGARTLEQLDDNLGALGWELSADHMDRLTSVSQAFTDPFPAHD
ncbi:aldo/keto reductase [Flindersiella endophytica]